MSARKPGISARAQGPGALGRVIEPAVAFLLIAILWEKAVDIFHVKPYLLPPLSKVVKTTWESRDLLLRES